MVVNNNVKNWSLPHLGRLSGRESHEEIQFEAAVSSWCGLFLFWSYDLETNLVKPAADFEALRMVKVHTCQEQTWPCFNQWLVLESSSKLIYPYLSMIYWSHITFYTYHHIMEKTHLCPTRVVFSASHPHQGLPLGFILVGLRAHCILECPPLLVALVNLLPFASGAGGGACRGPVRTGLLHLQFGGKLNQEFVVVPGSIVDPLHLLG